MDIIASLGLIVIILLALNYMGGGKSSNVLRPVGGLVGGVVRFAVNLCLGGIGFVGRLLGGSISSAASGGVKKLTDDKNEPPAGRTPPRWD